jgi:hypothetical protein
MSARYPCTVTDDTPRAAGVRVRISGVCRTVALGRACSSTSADGSTVRPTPRISCEARLNEEKITLDTYLQVSRASSAASACWAGTQLASARTRASYRTLDRRATYALHQRINEGAVLVLA